jgi:oxygen-independent coproporphyrinogen-3 oxidase
VLFQLYDELLNTKSKKLVGFDIGGGTPSMATIAEIGRIMENVHKHFIVPSPEEMEISIETTPKIAAADPEKIKAYYQMGIRRISMGVQTTDFRQAKDIGRDDANSDSPIDTLRRAVDNIRTAGFKSFNVDIMYGFPGKALCACNTCCSNCRLTIDFCWCMRDTVRAGRPDPFPTTVSDALNLEPDHVTLYRMRYKGTKLAHLMDRVNLDQVNEQGVHANRILEQNGYTLHGLHGKNTYSRTPGNSGCSDYLDKRVQYGIPYIGMGLGAQSFSHYALSYNLGAVTKKLGQYIRSVNLGRIPIQDLYHLPASGIMGKFCSVSFYYGGIDVQAFKEIFRQKFEDVFSDKIAFLQANGLMEYITCRRTGRRRFQMTPEGKKCFGGVVAMFYAPAVQGHLIEREGGEDEVVKTIPQRIPAAAGAARTGFSSSQQLAQQRGVHTAQKRTFGTAAPRDTAKNAASSDSPFEFGNILFGGPCNQKCWFCIGKQLDPAITPTNLKTPVEQLKGLQAFIDTMRETRTSKVIFTGTRTDPQLYKYESELIDRLRSELPGVHISLHTNGLLAVRKIDTFNKYDSCTISVNSFQPETFRKLHGVKTMPDLRSLVQLSKIPIKLSCVLTNDNIGEVDSYLERCNELGVRRVAFRHLFGEQYLQQRYGHIFAHLTPSKIFHGNPVYTVKGVEATHWTFERMSKPSINLFSDGTLSTRYLLVDAPQKKIQASCS